MENKVFKLYFCLNGAPGWRASVEKFHPSFLPSFQCNHAPKTRRYSVIFVSFVKNLKHIVWVSPIGLLNLSEPTAGWGVKALPKQRERRECRRDLREVILGLNPGSMTLHTFFLSVPCWGTLWVTTFICPMDEWMNLWMNAYTLKVPRSSQIKWHKCRIEEVASDLKLWETRVLPDLNTLLRSWWNLPFENLGGEKDTGVISSELLQLCPTWSLFSVINKGDCWG